MQNCHQKSNLEYTRGMCSECADPSPILSDFTIPGIETNTSVTDSNVFNHHANLSVRQTVVCYRFSDIQAMYLALNRLALSGDAMAQLDCFGVCEFNFFPKSHFSFAECGS